MYGRASTEARISFKQSIRIWRNMLSILKKIMPIFVSTCTIENCKMVIIVRTDIVMGKGKIAAQCAHAALECYRKATANPKKHYMFKDWLYNGQPKIVLKVSSEVELLDLVNKAQKVGITTAIIRDAGRTQLQSGTISVIGIGPGLNTEINKITSHLKLL